MNLFLVPRYGLVAAAWIAVLTESILVVQHLVTLRSVIPTIPRKAEIILVFLPPIGMAAAALVLRDLFPFWAVFATCILTYGILVVLTRAISKKEILHFWGLITARKNKVSEVRGL